MSEQEIFDILIQILKDSIDDENFDFSKITMESDLFHEVITNSISAMYVALSIEDRFQIEMDNESLKKLKTVKDFIHYIQTKTEQD